MGAGTVARATPDGHTLLLTPNTLAISPHVLAASAVGNLDDLCCTVVGINDCFADFKLHVANSLQKQPFYHTLRGL